MRPSDLPHHPRVVACDTETSGTHPDDGARVSVVSVAWLDSSQTIRSTAFPFDQGPLDKNILSPSLFDDQENAVNLPQEEWEYLLHWLSQRRLVFHYAQFDLMMLRAGTRKWPGRNLESAFWWCTMVAQRELDPTHQVGLDATCRRLGLGSKASLNVSRRRQDPSEARGRYDLLPWSAVSPYAAQDATLAMRLYLNQLARLEGDDITYGFIQDQFRRLRVYYHMGLRGIPYDSSRSLEIVDDLEEAKEKLAASLPFDPQVNNAKRFFFIDKPPRGLGLIPYETTPKKNEPKLTDQILDKMVKDGHLYAAEYRAWNYIDTAISMWYGGYPALVGADGRLRTVYRQTKVVSGRTSVERVNLQAIPHDYRLANLPEGTPPVRSLFRPRDGNKLYELDLAQAELRVAARLAHCTPMLELIKAKEDLHGTTARQLFPDADPSYTRTWTRFRQIAKRGNFSLIFGVGAPTFQSALAKEGVEVSRKECERIIVVWRRLYPHFGRAIRRTQELAERQGFVRLVNGRTRQFRDYEEFHKAFNQKVQGSIAEAVGEWMVEVDTRIPGILLLMIHDSLVLEVEDSPSGLEQVKWAADWATRRMTQLFQVPMEAGYKEWQ